MVGVLHDVELVVDDLALAGPLLDAESKRLPHIHTGGLDPPPLPGTERLEEFVQALSSVRSSTTAVHPSPDCTPPLETSASCPNRSHLHPSAARLACAATHPI